MAVFQQILSCAPQHIRVVLQATDAVIATPAKKGSNFASTMVVIHGN